MIVLDDKKIIIITPPHTASGNLHRALCSPEHRAFWYVGPSPEDWSPDHHYSKVANGKKGHHTALVVRHPLDRLVGLWWHYVYACKYLSDLTTWWQFPQFVEEVAAGNMDLFYIYRWTMKQLVSGQRIDSLIRYESLQEDINKLIGTEVKIEPPYGNTANRVPWQQMFRKQRTAQLAIDWSLGDFEAYGYEIPDPAHLVR